MQKSIGKIVTDQPVVELNYKEWLDEVRVAEYKLVGDFHPERLRVRKKECSIHELSLVLLEFRSSVKDLHEVNLESKVQKGKIVLEYC